LTGFKSDNSFIGENYVQEFIVDRPHLEFSSAFEGVIQVDIALDKVMYGLLAGNRFDGFFAGR
jgi:hypothetical protein